MPRFSFFLRLPVLLFVVHIYVAWRLATGFSDGYLRGAVVLTLASVYLIMMAGFLARGKVGLRAADALSWAGFLMLGFFSWLFVFTVLRDLVLLLIYVMQTMIYSNDPDWTSQVRRSSAWAVIVISIAACLLGFFNARRLPAIRHVDVVIPGLPPSLDGFSITQITDLHVGPTIKKGFVQRVVDLSNTLDADIVVLTGDLVDGSVKHLGSHTLPLSSLSARHGVYAVTGNHEYYVGALPWINELERLGITVLLNQHRVVFKDHVKLVLAGVTDFGAGRFIESHTSDPVAALQDAPDDAAVKILLAHQPRSIFAAASLGFDLQLSGHTHGGQYWPWGYFVPLQQPFVAGLHKYQGMQVYISRGTGYWGPPLRMGARSEISVIVLRQDVHGHT